MAKNTFFAENPDKYTVPMPAFPLNLTKPAVYAAHDKYIENLEKYTSELSDKKKRLGGVEVKTDVDDAGNFFSDVNFGEPSGSANWSIGQVLDLGKDAWEGTESATANSVAPPEGRFYQNLDGSVPSSFIGGGIGTLVGAFSPIPGLGLVGSLLGSGFDAYEANYGPGGLASLGAEKLGFGDWLYSAMPWGPSIEELANRNWSVFYGNEDETGDFWENTPEATAFMGLADETEAPANEFGWDPEEPDDDFDESYGLDDDDDDESYGQDDPGASYGQGGLVTGNSGIASLAEGGIPFTEPTEPIKPLDLAKQDATEWLTLYADNQLRVLGRATPSSASIAVEPINKDLKARLGLQSRFKKTPGGNTVSNTVSGNIGPVELYAQRDRLNQDPRIDTVGASASLPFVDGTLFGNVNRQFVAEQDPVTNYGLGWKGKVGPGKLFGNVNRQFVAEQDPVTNYGVGWKGKVGPGKLYVHGNVTDPRGGKSQYNAGASYYINRLFGLPGRVGAYISPDGAGLRWGN